MHTKIILLGLLILSGCSGARAKPLDSGWAELGRSEMVAVWIARRLYEQAGNPHFLIRVRVANRTGSLLGIDLRDGWGVFYPNQWGGLAQPERMIIDEAFTEPLRLTPDLEARLRADYRAKALVMIPAGGSTEYFREFNASGRADIDRTSEAYLFVSIRGQIFVTDGVAVENLQPSAGSLYLHTPIRWSTVPQGARTVPD